MRASDQRIPERTATAEVRINIIRDRFPPIFFNEPYGTSVSENTVNGTSVYRVTANDQDLRVSIYRVEIRGERWEGRILGSVLIG